MNPDLAPPFFPGVSTSVEIMDCTVILLDIYRILVM